MSKNLNIFIFSVDSLRTDSIGFYSGNTNSTPNIDLFSQESVHFTDHHITVPRTFPSWADLLTGNLSFQHGINSMFPSKQEANSIGTATIPTIATYLNGRGYSTSVLSGFAGDIFPRANFGFQTVQTPHFNARFLTSIRAIETQIFFLPILSGSFLLGGEYIKEVKGLPTLGDDNRLLPDFIKLVTNGNSTKSIFHLYFSSVAHFPYSPPYPHYKKFTDPKYYGRYKYHKFLDPSDDSDPTNEEIKQIRGLYQSSVYSFDEFFGKLLSILKKNNLYDNSLIILTSDHGESLFESNLGQGHGEHLHGESVTKVPLLIRFPIQIMEKYNLQKGMKYPGITTSLDIFPTILDILGEENSRLPGQSLLKLTLLKPGVQERFVYSESGIWFSDRGDHFFQKKRIPYPNILEIHDLDPDDHQIRIENPFYKKKLILSKYRAIQGNRYKLIYIPTREGVEYELYDRINDPWNQRDLSKLPEYAFLLIQWKEKFHNFMAKNSSYERIGDFWMPKF